METEYDDKLWQKVEICMAFWCGTSAIGCSCPTQTKLRESSSEALTAILRALKDNSYVGDWKKYLGP